MTETTSVPPVDTEGFEWAVVEIFGHRRHFGRAREEERFGSKMLRIDVPAVEWTEGENPERLATAWVSHFYGGAAIFSFTLTDEETVLRANAPYRAPSRYSLPAPDDVEEQDFQQQSFCEEENE